MKTIIVIALLMITIGISDVRSENIYSLIMEGRVQEAEDSLSRMTTAATRDGDVLFFRSLLEPDAEASARMMEAALKSSVSFSYRQEIYYRLAQYYLITANYSRLSEIVNEYRIRWESGRYEREMIRFSVFIDELSGDYESALRQADRYQVRFSDGEAAQWGRLDRARILKADGREIGSQKLLRELSREKDGLGVPQSLYLLTLDAVERKRTEDAVFYYNLLREGYPLAIGLDALIDRIGSISGGYEQSNAAEKLTGTYYSIKVGVFSSRSNARKQGDLFKGYDRKIDYGEKNISGKKYHVVYVGRFSSYSEAYDFKTSLEATHGEVYQVVAR